MGLPGHGTKQCADLVCQSWLEWWVSRNDKTPVMFALRTVLAVKSFQVAGLNRQRFQLGGTSSLIKCSMCRLLQIRQYV